MRVLFYLSRFPEPSHTFIRSQISGLIEAGVDVHVLAGDRSRAADADRHWPADLPEVNVSFAPSCPGRYCTQLADHARRSVGRVLRRRPGAIRCWNPVAFRRRTLLGQLTRHAQAFESIPTPDLVHAHFGPIGERLAQLQELGVVRQPCVTTIHGYGATRFDVIGQTNPYRYLSTRATRIHTVSEFLLQQMIRLGIPRDSLRVHRVGIDLDRFSFRPRKGKVDTPMKIVTVGRFVEKKGISHLVAGFHAASRRGLNAHLTLIGDGPLRNAIETQAKDLGVIDRIQFTGWISPHEVSTTLDESDVFALTSVTSKDGDMEGVPTSIMEAMARGLPVISTLHAGIPELVKDGQSGLLSPEADEEAIAENLLQLSSFPDRWEAMGRAGRSSIESFFDGRVLNADLLDQYNELIRISTNRRRATRK